MGGGEFNSSVLFEVLRLSENVKPLQRFSQSQFAYLYLHNEPDDVLKIELNIHVSSLSTL